MLKKLRILLLALLTALCCTVTALAADYATSQEAPTLPHMEPT